MLITTFKNMNKRLLFVICFSGIVSWLSGQASLNMDLLGQWDDPTLIVFGGQKYNDIWGYAADGKEYAIMGSIRKVHFLDVTDPGNIEEIAAIEAPSGVGNSYWRDYKTYGHYAYGVADVGNEGLLVFDLSDLPNSVTLANQITSEFTRSHNVWIDTLTGRLYACGVNISPARLVIYDLNADPVNPPEIGMPPLPGGYVHDLHVRNNIGFCNHGNNGMYVYDFTNPDNPALLGSLTNYIDAGYNHSCWLTDDENTMVFCDENFGKTVKTCSVEDLSDMFVIDTFRSTLLAPDHINSIAHNPFILGDYVYIAYYHDGLQVYDIADPASPFKVAFYDTYPDNTSYSGFNGAWGTYPYLPSGNIITSDMTYGLYVTSLNITFLPVDILSFLGSKEKSGIRLDWQVDNTKAVKTFEVQKLIDESFAKVEVLDVQPSDEKQDFYAIDRNPLDGLNYYRLRTVFNDGDYNYSKLISVRWNDADADQYKVYPSLTLAGSTIHLEQKARGVKAIDIYLTSMNGQMVNLGQQIISDREPLRIELPQKLSSGVYVLNIVDRGNPGLSTLLNITIH